MARHRIRCFDFSQCVHHTAWSLLHFSHWFAYICELRAGCLCSLFLHPPRIQFLYFCLRARYFCCWKRGGLLHTWQRCVLACVWRHFEHCQHFGYLRGYLGGKICARARSYASCPCFPTFSHFCIKQIPEWLQQGHAHCPAADAEFLPGDSAFIDVRKCGSHQHVVGLPQWAGSWQLCRSWHYYVDAFRNHDNGWLDDNNPTMFGDSPIFTVFLCPVCVFFPVINLHCASHFYWTSYWRKGREETGETAEKEKEKTCHATRDQHARNPRPGLLRFILPLKLRVFSVWTLGRGARLTFHWPFRSRARSERTLVCYQWCASWMAKGTGWNILERWPGEPSVQSIAFLRRRILW